MLNFFRKYQKFFFFFITVVIVFSFVFFGTYQAIAPAFRKNGNEEESYVSQMSRFLNSEQWMVSRRFFETNFLNEGILSKEFLETGMGDLVANAYPEKFQKEFETKLEEEKKYLPYSHPYIPSLSASSIWSMFAPDLLSKLKEHQLGKAEFKKRKDLFLAQKSFPPAFLSQVIHYQEQKNSHFPADPRLGREEIALFDYSTLSDWFGENYVEALSKTIIHSADIARKLGYRVSKQELLTELLTRSQETYNGIKDKISLPVQNGYGLFHLYLQQIGMREERVLKIWEDVTLFKRLMHAVGDAALIDNLALGQFYAYADSKVIVELIHFPKTVQLKSEEDLKKFEVYLAAVGENRNSIFAIPNHYAPILAIEAKAPELVGKKFHLSVASIDKKILQAKVTIKQMQQWECESDNWKIVQRQFPELVQKQGTPFSVLESLDGKTRKLVDQFARKQIAKEHPEWIEESLVAAEMKQKKLFLSAHTPSPFEGISDMNALLCALQQQDELMSYTQDNEHYYRFLIHDKSQDKQVMTYLEALQAKVLDKLVEPLKGEEQLRKVVEATPKQHQNHAYAYRLAPILALYGEIPLEGELAKQFAVETTEVTITRSHPSFISLEEALALEVGALCPLKIDPQEGAFRYRVKERSNQTTLPLDKMLRAQEILSQEARCRYFENQCLKTCSL